MNHQRTDEPAVSEEQRELWRFDARSGRTPYVPTPPSRRRLGRVLDVLERIFRSFDSGVGR